MLSCLYLNPRSWAIISYQKPVFSSKQRCCWATQTSLKTLWTSFDMSPGESDCWQDKPPIPARNLKNLLSKLSLPVLTFVAAAILPHRIILSFKYQGTIIFGHLKMLREALTDLISLVLSLMSTIFSDRKNPTYGPYNTCCAQSVHPKPFWLYTINSIGGD